MNETTDFFDEDWIKKLSDEEKKEYQVNNTRKTYVPHMENENENKDVIDIESRKKIFAEKVNLFGQTLPKETLISFYEYWTEHNEGGKKIRFEMINHLILSLFYFFNYTLKFIASYWGARF